MRKIMTLFVREKLVDLPPKKKAGGVFLKNVKR